MTNAQRRALALNRMAELNASSSDNKPELTKSNAFCPHAAGAYYIATIGNAGRTINLLEMEIERTTYTYTITAINFEQDIETGKWVWFDGKEKLSPRNNQNSWRLGSYKLYATRDEAEAELQKAMLKNGDRVANVHVLPDDVTALKKIRSAHHPDRNNPDSDHDLYQAVIEKMDRMRAVSA